MENNPAKNSIPISFFRGVSNPIAIAYLLINHLKQLYRKGYLVEPRNIKLEKCESVADHCFGVVMLISLIMTLYPIKLNWQKVLLMAIIHEFGEVFSGDIGPKDGVSKEEKYRREKEGINLILSDFPEGQVLIDLWEEYVAQITPESQFVKQIDRLETGLQSCVYNRQYGMPNQDFIDDVLSHLNDPLLVSVLSSVVYST